MKRFTFTLLSLILSASFSPAQEEAVPGTPDTLLYEDESCTVSYRENDMFRLLKEPMGQIGLHFLHTPLMKQQAFGIAFDLTARYTQNLAAGLSLSFASRKIVADFGYMLGEPLLNYFDISLFNEFRFVQWHGLDLGLRLNTGYSTFRLCDNSVKETYTWYDEFGNAYEGESPLSVASNSFMRIAPELMVQYHFTRGLAAEAGAAYNFFLGSPRFGHNSDFRNYQLRLGLKVDL